MMSQRPLAVRAVLFDLDGTLIDTVLDLHAAANAMLGDLGRPEIAVAAIRSYVGRGIPNLVKRVLAGSMVAADDPRRRPRQRWTVSGTTTPLPTDATRSFFRASSKASKLQGPGPAARRDYQQGRSLFRAAARASVWHLFSRWSSAATFCRAPKPDPMPLLWASGRLGVSPADVLMIGDSVHDFHAGARPAATSFWCPTATTKGATSSDLACDAIVSTLAEAAQRVSHA
jgi:phosphoglycolate phosphatase